MRVKKNFGGKRKGYKGKKWYDSGLARFLTPLGSNRSMLSRAGNVKTTFFPAGNTNQLFTNWGILRINEIYKFK